MLVYSNKQTKELKGNLSNLSMSLNQLINTNENEHEKLLRESQNAIAQLNEDSQFLGHIKEIIRFYKKV